MNGGGRGPLEPAATPTPIIYLDVDDEITSAAARVRRAIGDRLAVVLPYGSRVATSRINFRLLAREASERGKQIEIVTADPSARALATAAGLPAYASVAEFEGSGAGGAAQAGLDVLAAEGAAIGAAGNGELMLPWGTPGPATVPTRRSPPPAGDAPTRRLRQPQSEMPKIPIVGRARPVMSPRLAVAVLSVLALVLLVGGAVAYAALPAATITVAPRTERLGPLSLVVSAQPSATAPDATALVIPATTFTFDAQASQSFKATGVQVSEAKATGNVTFSSFDTGNTNKIPAGAIVSTESGIQFMTLATATMPPATISFPDAIVVPSTATVAIEAVKLGPSGNVTAGTITVLPKSENKNLTRVTNTEPTSGGAHDEAPQVSQADVDAALQALDDALKADFDAKFAAATGVPVGTTIFPETKLLGSSTPSVDPATLVGTLATDFSLGLTAQGTVLGVDSAPVRGLAETRLKARLPGGWSLVDGSIQIDVGTPIVAGDTISFPVKARALQVRDVNAPALVAAIRGLGLAEARARLEEYGNVSIVLWPDWVTTVPTNDSRISFTVGEAAPLETPGASPSGSSSASPEGSPALESPASTQASPAP